MKIYLETYGCTANKSDETSIIGILKENNYKITEEIHNADLLVLVTCTVIGTTEQRMLSRLKVFKQTNKDIIVAGCMHNVRNKKLYKLDNVYLLGTRDVKNILKLISKIADEKEIHYITGKDEIKLLTSKKLENKKIGITQVSEGCVGRCSFCLTRLAKGQLYSYPQDKIIENIKKDLKSGCREIWLTSQDSGCYGLDISKGRYLLPDLLKKILALEGKFKVRLGMVNPDHVLKMLDELIDIYRDEKMFKFLHLPLQSGSNKILKAMNRKYKTEDLLKIISAFRKVFPDITVATDVIVGFPGETDEDFKETVNLIKYLKPQILNISRYWAMRGTVAERLEKINRDIDNDLERCSNPPVVIRDGRGNDQ